MCHRTLLVFAALPLFAQSTLPPQVRFRQDFINSVVIGSHTAVYASPSPKAPITQLLLTHARRDAVGAVPPNAYLFVPAQEKELFQEPERFWEQMKMIQFHDYAQISTKIPVHGYANTRAVEDNDQIPVEGATVRAISTPGYTPGAVSYVIDVDGKRVVCTGDLIYGDGKIIDLYSLQDAVPEAKARGYHGYAARAGALIASLRKVAGLKPDVLLPARGPIITNPQRAIAQLITRLQTFLQSHFETDALRWYWGDDNHRIRSRAVERRMDVLPMAEQGQLPPDILAIGNSRLIVSKTGAAFLVDAGYNQILPELQKMRAQRKIRSVDGIWITHYHDDHTEYVNDVVNEFHSAVYFTQAMDEVITNPAAFRLPCLTTRPITDGVAKADGETLQWNEWQFTFWNFPGQTLYHGGLVARRDDGQTYLFVGDSFTPSGMDDYCMQNRTYLRRGEGYDFCLRRIASLPENSWLLNQHVVPMFRYTPAQVLRMQEELNKRSGILREMSPWPDINYMTDESWARVYPYSSDAERGQLVTLTVRIKNHAQAQTTYRVRWNLPGGWTMVETGRPATIRAGKDGQVEGTFRAPGPGLYVITADVVFGGWDLHEWTEALVRIR
jgi:glyoxylase-like metal-dependent hydrolase (beta-lactamase superfamily II)